MNEFIKTIIGPVIGGLIAAGIGFGMSFIYRCRDARDDSTAVIADQRAKLDLHPNEGDKFFQESLPVLSQAVHRVRRFVSDDQWVSLSKTWYEYRGQDSHRVNRNVPAAIDVFTGTMPDQKLRDFLDRFDKCIKDCPCMV